MRLPSSSLQLEKIIGKKLFATLSAREPDGRELFGLAAKQLRITELQLMVHLGYQMGLPVLQNLAEEITVLQVAEIMPKTHERAAFVLIKMGSSFHAIACLDPAWVSPYLNQTKQFQIVLSPWSLLKKLISGNSSTNHAPDNQLRESNHFFQ